MAIMNKYTLDVPFSDKDFAKNFGAIWHGKKWVYYGELLPRNLAPFLAMTQLAIEKRCNTCGFEFDGEDGVYRQSKSNSGYLATKVRGKVVQECCESCVQECEEAAKNEN